MKTNKIIICLCSLLVFSGPALTGAQGEQGDPEIGNNDKYKNQQGLEIHPPQDSKEIKPGADGPDLQQNEEGKEEQISDFRDNNKQPSPKPNDNVGDENDLHHQDTPELENQTNTQPKSNSPEEPVDEESQSQDEGTPVDEALDIHKDEGNASLVEGETGEADTEEAANLTLRDETKARSAGEGNLQYQYNGQGEIVLAQEYANEQLTKIHEYYPADPNAREQKIKYTFELNSAGHIVRATELAKENQAPLAKFEYYPGTAYGNHGKRIKFHFTLNSSGHITKAVEREVDSQRMKTVYEYHSGTTYGTHGKRIKFGFTLNGSGNITKAVEREVNSQRMQAVYEYHSGTKYGSHGKRIKYSFTLNSSGYITKALEREVNSQRIKAVYEYHSSTKYGAHGKRIKYGFTLNSSGYVVSAVKREAGTQRIVSRYEYYSNAKFGQHGSKIKYVFDLNASGHITKATLREAGTGRILTAYGYQPNTSYGNHGAKIVSIKLNVPLVSQLPELPTGCEITAVTMMLNYKGAKVNKTGLADEMPRHSWDPNIGYVGNPYTKNGWTVYPPALMKLVDKYAGSARNVTGASHLLLEQLISNNHPVVLWASPMHGFTVHAITLTGYDKTYYYYNDPWTGKKDVKMEKSKLLDLWEDQKKRAITY